MPATVASGRGGSSAPPLVHRLISVQGKDGGWGYGRGASWTEPTSLALLALLASNSAGPPVARGIDWLLRSRRPDSGWPPAPSVERSTWVTALAVIVLASAARLASYDPAIDWLFTQTGRESSMIHKLRQRLLGSPPDPLLKYDGWPWFPGAAAWVTPTSLTIVALKQIQKKDRREAIAARIREGQRYLLSRVCADGGWNHGSSKALGYDSDSYPETTGIALLALAGLDSPKIRAGITRAERHLENCPSWEAFCWLRLGLAAHGKTSAPARTFTEHPGVIEVSLRILAESKPVNNPLLEL